MTAAPTSIDEYLARLPADQRSALQALRTVIRRAAPDAEERLSYGICAFRHGGMLVGFGATRTHCAFYLMSGRTVEDHAELLEGYDTSKGTIRFTPDAPLPASLVRRLVKARLAENREEGGGNAPARRAAARTGPKAAAKRPRAAAGRRKP
jgi:uncharacterized protein YdhG (YjbR/CyaY superfamily)